MKQFLANKVKVAVDCLQQQGKLVLDTLPEIQIDHTRDKKFGDFASNIAMLLAKSAKMSPRQIADMIMGAIAPCKEIDHIEIANPGFINFFIANDALTGIIGEIIASGEDFGRSEYGDNALINIEFVSANPTGPLHVGHGRSVAYGATCANLLEAIGYRTHREYYVNDGGRQMDILAVSVWLRYLENFGEKFTFPHNAYKGDYILDIAAQIKKQHGDALHWPIATVFADLPHDHDDPLHDQEQFMDSLIAKTQALLGDTGYQAVHGEALNTILDDIRDDLSASGVDYDHWFSEQNLLKNGALTRCIEQLQKNQHTYEKEGNLWFKATAFGDDKDRVLLRSNGKPTYFAADIAYHLTKFERGANACVDIFGADHHGYMIRVQASMEAFHIPREKIQMLLVQFATLYRGKTKISMSTRSGSFVTLRELRDEIGKDAMRFFYILRKVEQHLEFDIEIAKAKNNENPVYYIQYAHARICRVLEQLEQKGWVWEKDMGLTQLNLLSEPHEVALIEHLSRYREMIHHAAINYEPHLLAHYLRELANHFHAYYNAHVFLVEEADLRNARLCLILATQQVLKNGLHLLGVSAPMKM
jgi:arginyl-tRNA synthetase